MYGAMWFMFARPLVLITRNIFQLVNFFAGFERWYMRVFICILRKSFLQHSYETNISSFAPFNYISVVAHKTLFATCRVVNNTKTLGESVKYGAHYMAL